MENLRPPLPSGESQDLTALMASLGREARKAAKTLALASTETKNQALSGAAEKIRQNPAKILSANAQDIDLAKTKGLSAAFIDRLSLDEARITAMAKGLEDIASLPDPVGREMAAFDRPNGMRIERIATPLGVIGIIYEARPAVTADAGGLCLKSGNASILRGGSESFFTTEIIHHYLVVALREAGLPETAITRVPSSDRAAVGEMLKGLNGDLDVIVPRGGKELVARVHAEARVPVFAHLEGIVHVYVHAEADPAKALSILRNSKMRRTGICGAAETLLVDREAAQRHLAPLVKMLLDSGCAVRGDRATCAVDPRVTPAVEEDWRTEYLDAIISVRVVEGFEAAIDHIETFGSHHTDCIITENAAAAERFLREVDSAICVHNASTQFADGGEFGFGAEIGIATGRMHARGPVGLEQLTTFKYRIHGSGQTRP